MPERIKLLRYAQLTFKLEELRKRQLHLPEDEVAEQEKIRDELGRPHDQILVEALEIILGN